MCVSVCVYVCMCVYVCVSECVCVYVCVCDAVDIFAPSSLCKDVNSRPHYSQLLQHPLIIQYDQRPVDIAAWYTEVCSKHGTP